MFCITYEENYEAARTIGRMLEHKGFIPHYYYSGNKSIHIHVFLSWEGLNGMYWDEFEQTAKKIGTVIDKEIKQYEKKFMEWLREKMINCWDTKAEEFDKELIKSTHLIRAELSKNKKGFKTFLGYSYKDLSSIPYICNENNSIYPRLGEIRLSQPHIIKSLLEDFQNSFDDKTKLKKIHKKNRTLINWFKPKDQTQLRDCIKLILHDDFKDYSDGKQRGFFFLLNELRIVFGDIQAKIIIEDWNDRMGNPITKQAIDYRFKLKVYQNIGCKKIHGFLDEIGLKNIICNKKV